MLGTAKLKKREEEEKAARQVASGGVTPAMSNAIRQIAMEEAAAELAQAKAGGAVGVLLPRASDNVRSGLGPGRAASLPGSVDSGTASMNGGDGYLARWDDGLSSAREQAEIAAWEAEQARRRAAALAAAREEQARAAAEQANTQNASTKKEIPLLSDAEREARAKAAREAEAAYMNSKVVSDQILQERKAEEAKRAERANAAKAAEAAYMESKWIQDEEKTKYRGPVKEGTSMLKAPTRIESVLDRNDKFALPIVNKPVIQKGIRESIETVPEYWDSIYAGARAFDSGLAQTANSYVNFAESITDSLNIDAPWLNNIYDYYENMAQEKKEIAQKDIDDGTINPIVSTIVEATPDIGMQILIALMSGGASLAATPVLSPTISKFASYLYPMITNPQFWNSAAKVFGNSYQDAVAAGANDIQAFSTAIQHALPSAMIEASGGVETLVNKAFGGKALSGAVGKSSASDTLNAAKNTFSKIFQQAKNTGLTDEQAISTAIRQAVPAATVELYGGVKALASDILNGNNPLSIALKSGLEEGLEGVIQYPLAEASKVAGYGKAPVIYSTEGDALINPRHMAEEFGVGFLGGAFGGAVGAAGNRLATYTGNKFLPSPATKEKLDNSNQEVQENYATEANNIVQPEQNEVYKEETKSNNITRVDSLLEKIKNGEHVTNKDMEFLFPGENTDWEAREEFEQKTNTVLPNSVSGTRNLIREYQAISDMKEGSTEVGVSLDNLIPIPDNGEGPKKDHRFELLKRQNNARSALYNLESLQKRRRINQISKEPRFQVNKKDIAAAKAKYEEAIKEYNDYLEKHFTVKGKNDLQEGVPEIEVETGPTAFQKELMEIARTIPSVNEEMATEPPLAEQVDKEVSKDDLLGMLNAMMPKVPEPAPVMLPKASETVKEVKADQQSQAGQEAEKAVEEKLQELPLLEPPVKEENVPKALPKASDAVQDGKTETVAVKKVAPKKLPKASDIRSQEAAVQTEDSSPVVLSAKQKEATKTSAKAEKSSTSQPVRANKPADSAKTEAAAEPVVQKKEHRYSEEYQDLLNRYGAIRHGEIPKNGTQNMSRLTPKQSGEGKYVSEFARTVVESGTTSEELFDAIQRKIADHDLSHTQKKDKDALRNAAKLAKNGELEKAWDTAKDRIGGITKEDVAIGARLLVEASHEKDVALAEDVLTDLATSGTQAGQVLQAFSLLKKMSPIGKALYVKKLVKSINSDIKESRKYRNVKVTVKENGDLVTKKIKELSNDQDVVSISEKAIEKIISAKNTEERNAAIDDAYTEIAEQLPATLGERFDAWRKAAMLGNIKTTVKNEIGDASMVPLTFVKDTIGIALEKAFLRGDNKNLRTKAFLTNSESDNALKALAEKSFDSIDEKSNKYQDAQDLFRKRKLLPAPVQKYGDFFNDLQTKTDTRYKKIAYKRAFASIAKARGYTAEFLKKDLKSARKAFAECDDYAYQQALEATFQQRSDVARYLNELSKKNGFAHYIIEGNIPFRKTPINITTTAFNYSPVGLFAGLARYLDGDRSAAAIDQMAKGVAGSSFAALGGLLAHLGLITTGEAEEDKDRYADAMAGKQSYAIQIGDYSISLSFLSPAAIPLFFGAEVYDFFANNSDEGIAEILEDIGNLAAPIFDMSMLEGLDDLLSSIGKPDKLISAATSFGLNYVLQAIPSAAGKIARIIDPVRRSNQPDATNKDIPKDVQKALNKAIAKIPGLSMTLQPYVDPMGNQDVADNTVWNIVEQFISPTYVEKMGESDEMKEIRRVSSAMGETEIMPGYVEDYLTVNKEKVLLSAAQVTERQTVTGTAYAQIVKELMETDSYKNRDDAGKYALIKAAYTYAKAMGNMAVSDYKPNDKWILNANKAADSGIPISTFLEARDLYSSDEFKDNKKKREWLWDQDLTDEQRGLLDNLLISDNTGVPVEKEVDYSSKAMYNITSLHPDTANKIKGIIGGKITDQVAWKTYEATSRYTGEGASDLKRQYIMNLSGLSGAEKKKLAQVFVDKDDSRDYSSIAMFNISGMNKNYQEKYDSIKGNVSAEQFWAAYKACDKATWPKNTKGARESALRAAIRSSSRNLTAAQVNLLYEQFKNMQQD